MTQDSNDKEITKPGTAKPVRRVAKTLLVGDSPELRKLRTLLEIDQAPKSKEVAKTLIEEPRPVAEKPRSGRKVSRTLKEIDLPSIEHIQAHAAKMKGTEKPKAMARKQNYVAKTMLDHSLLAETRMKFELRKAEIAKEEEAQRAKNPPIEILPIDCKKLAQECPWRWDDGDKAERFRYCQKCQTPIYNLDELDISEAEALVFTRENKDKPTFYKRPDGKFMTQGCPVGIKRKKRLVVLSIVAATLVLAIVAIMILAPPPTMRAPQSSGDAVTVSGEVSGSGFGSKGANLGAGGSEGNTVTTGQQGALQTQIDGSGKRKRPTFGPEDKGSYWQ